MHAGKTTAAVLAATGCLALLTGCVGMGARTIARDRAGYTDALAQSWKNQMLLNVVKIRYGDTPVFLDIAQVVNSYEYSGQAAAGSSWKFTPGYESGMDMKGSFGAVNKPTITYTPLSGEKFARSLMAPIPPSSILNLVQSGYPVDLVFRGLVQSVNGVRNRFGGSSGPREADPDFPRLLEHFKGIQATGAMGMRIERMGEREGDVSAIVFRGHVEDKSENDIKEVGRILKLDPSNAQYRVVFGLLPADGHEISMLTRSVYQILIELASYVEVPESDIQENRAGAGVSRERAGTVTPPLIAIHSGKKAPDDAYAAVPYGGQWFWIDGRDLASKRGFSFLMFVFSMVETGDKDAKPVVTIPVR